MSEFLEELEGLRKHRRSELAAFRAFKEIGIPTGLPLGLDAGSNFEFAEGENEMLATCKRFVASLREGTKNDSAVSGREAAAEDPAQEELSDAEAEAYASGTRADFCRESISSNGFPKKTQYWILDSACSVETKEVIKVRLQKALIKPSCANRLDYLNRTQNLAQKTLGGPAERAAMRKLREVVGPLAFDAYQVTGNCVILGRSGVTYIVRRMRPTVALRGSNILCALCLHPLGYFKDTWVGAMTPTDEVVAHILMIRGDEHRFWKKANQIPIWEDNSGI